MPIAPFPHTYAVSLENDSLAAATRPRIPCGPPPQFGGNDQVWSPEHLLLAATLSCLKTTFDAYARRERITVHDWHGRATGTLVKTANGPSFSAIDLEVDVVVAAGEEARAEATLAVAEHHCIISRALTAPVHVTAHAKSHPDQATG